MAKIRPLGCGLVKVEADFVSNVVTLFLPSQHSCDMGGAIQLATRANKNVKRIDTISGAQPDTYYVFKNKEWSAYEKEEPSRHSANAQRRAIEKARTVLLPSKVRQGHIPGWLGSACMVLCKSRDNLRKQHDYFSAFMEVTKLFSNDWLDHWGSSGISNEIFVSEPYLHNYKKTIDDASSFASFVGATLRITPNSWWFPGETTRFEFWNKDRL